MNNNRKLMKFFLIIAGISIISSSEPIYSQEIKTGTELQFNKIWEKVKLNSPSLKAAVSESKAAEISKDRSARHWFPTLYADAKAYTTNDPGLTFMSNMGQRSVMQNDFIPDNLNNPDAGNYQTGTLGIDLPLFEGGARVETAKAMEKIAEAKKLQNSSITLNEFTSAASAYGRMIVQMKIHDDLIAMSERVDTILSNYQGALKSNPVEYSGILSLKSLQNRIKVHLKENESKTEALRVYLDKMSGNSLPEGWIPAKSDSITFSDTFMKAENLTADGSFKIKALEAIAESSANRAEAEKAVFMPKIGIFGETNIYNGDRDTGDSYTAGFYIRMNIVSPMDYGAVKQAELESDALKFKAKEAKLNAEIELKRLYNFSDALKKNIATMRENTVLMNELVRTTHKLFTTGSIKSFQLVDVFSRRTDLIINLAAAEEEYLNVSAGIFSYSVQDVNNSTYVSGVK